MLFNSSVFFVFFTIFYVVYLLLGRRVRYQNFLILISSYIFYGWWDERFLLLIALSTTTDYLAGIGARGRKLTVSHLGLSVGFLVLVSVGLGVLDWHGNGLVLVGGLSFSVATVAVVIVLNRLKAQARRKAYLVTSLVVNLGILGFFKYFNFFAESLRQAAFSMGVELDAATLNIVLPVGISFYTFQTLSYTLDCYRERLEPTNQFLEHAAFVAFFPQLVAGPIERARNLLPQFSVPRVITLEKVNSGAVLFVWGLYKKVVIADNLAPIANRIFSDPMAFSSGEILVGVLAFTFQIFCDFSGYSDMARGLARVMGFELMLNFNIPYISRSPSEFWRRWHISLSSWLRDYLYIGMGGNQGGKLATYRNLLLTMLLGGLWHGASWTFIAWGAFHGSILVIYRLLGVDKLLDVKGRSQMASVAINISSWSLMFGLTLIGWVLFRAVTFFDAQMIFAGLLANNQWSSPTWSTLGFYVWPLLLIQAAQVVSGRLEIFFGLPRFARLNIALFMLLGVVLLSAPPGQEFIYFDF